MCYHPQVKYDFFHTLFLSNIDLAEPKSVAGDVRQFEGHQSLNKDRNFEDPPGGSIK